MRVPRTDDEFRVLKEYQDWKDNRAWGTLVGVFVLVPPTLWAVWTFLARPALPVPDVSYWTWLLVTWAVLIVLAWLRMALFS